MDENNILDSQQPVEVGDINSESVQAVAQDDEIVVFADVGYSYGTISSTYLDYFTGIVEKLGFDEEYVIWKSGDYSYSMVYGSDLSLTGDLITGYDLDCVRIYRENSSVNYNWFTKCETLDSLSLDVNGLFVYSSLGDMPTVERGLNTYEGLALLFAFGFAIVYSVCHDIFDYIMEHVYRK